MTDLNPNITKITLTINGLNTPIKENHQNIFFNNLHICSLQEIHLKCTNNIDWKQRDEKKKEKYALKTPTKESCMAILIPDKRDFREKKNARYREGEYIMIRVNLPKRHNNI